MRPRTAILALMLAFLPPAAASAQWNWWPFRYWRRSEDDYRLRRSLEEAAEQQRILRKQEYTRSTVQKPPTPIPSSPIEGLRERYILLEARIAKLQEERGKAVWEGASADKIAALDSQIEQLRMQADVLRDALGRAQ